MLRPLAFRNFLSKIFRKPKMGYAPHHHASRGASRRGCLWTATRREKQEVENKLRPSSVNSVDSFPPRGSHEVADNFCRRKFYSLKFSAGKGKPLRWTFFRIFALSKNEKGEGLQNEPQQRNAPTAYRRGKQIAKRAAFAQGVYK